VTERKFKILNLSALNSDGCSYVRHEIPHQALRDRGHYVQMKFPVHRTDFEIAILSRAIPKDLAETLIKMKMAGIKISYDADDLLFEIEETNPFFSDSRSRQAVVFLSYLMPLVDMVTCTNEKLAKELEEYTDAPIKILPNCVRPGDWKARPRTPGKPLRIGYTGSSSHHKELNFILPIISRLQKSYDVDFHLFGIFASIENMVELSEKKLDKPAAWQGLMKETIELLQKVVYTHHKFVPVQEYPAYLSGMDLDIGLCPLFPSKFNDCKSAIKLFEYALVDTAPVAANQGPYAGMGIVDSMDPEAWYTRLEQLIQDPDFRNETAANARAYVLDEFTIEKNIHLWEKAYSELLEPSRILLVGDKVNPEKIWQKRKEKGIIHA